MFDTNFDAGVMFMVPPEDSKADVDVSRMKDGRYHVQIHLAGNFIALHLTPQTAMRLMQALDKQLLADDQESDGSAAAYEASIAESLTPRSDG